MDRKGKGKQVAGTESSSGGKKRKNSVEFRDEGLRIKKLKNPEGLQFFDESAEVGYYGGSSDEDDDGLGFLNDIEDEPEVEEGSSKDGKGGKGKSSFVFPKEEEINEEEFDRILEERYKPGSGFFRYADNDVKDSIEMDALNPTSKDPPIWKVKCGIGLERHSVFCLRQKFVELRKIGTKLQIISVFSVEHVKGFIFIEAYKEHDVLEACKGLTGIYATRMVLLFKAEAPNLLTVKRKIKKNSEAKWARVMNGKYKGDLAEVVAVWDTRREALIKLIPRTDIQALTQKYGGGVTVLKGQTPAPRLISSSELEPIVQVRRDRFSGLNFEYLDGLRLKDGYLYKKVSIDSLSPWGVIPSKEEILKFTPIEQKETDDAEWISEIYGEEKKKKILPTGRGGGKGEGSGGEKGEGSSGSKSESSYELYNLVYVSRKDFGLIVGVVDDKGDSYKVLKEGSDGPVVVTVGKKELQSAPFDSKFTALDLNNKQISINDFVKISKGPSEGKQGIVRQVHRGIIFLYDESEEENGGYFCCKSQSCEKVKLFTEEFNKKTGGFYASAFGDSVSSPKSLLSPEKEWQHSLHFIVTVGFSKMIINAANQGDKGSMYSIGQKLRIRVGPLKGYLCRVIGLRYSDVTVELDSQHKIFTVKSEHLAEVRNRNTLLSTSGDAGNGSFQTFDMLGTEDSSGDWAKEAGTSGEGGNWNIAAPTTDLNSWSSKPTAPWIGRLSLRGGGVEKKPERNQKRKSQRKREFKNFTVRSEHHAEVRNRNTVRLTSADAITEKKKQPTVVWWDEENAPIPYDFSAKEFYSQFIKKLKAEGFTGRVTIYLVVGYLDSLKESVCSDLRENGIQIIHAIRTKRPIGTKNNQVADGKIKQYVDKWLMKKHRPPHNAMLITGDNGYSEHLQKLQAAGHTTLLVYRKINKKSSAKVCKYATFTWDWREFLCLSAKTRSKKDRNNDRLMRIKAEPAESKKKKKEDRKSMKRRAERELLIQKRITDNGMYEVRILGDGNCQFRAVSHQLYGTEDHYKEIRSQVVEQLRENSGLYKGFHVGDYDQFCTRLAKDREYGDHTTLHAMADFFDVDIHVVTSTDIKVIEPQNSVSSERRQLWVSFTSQGLDGGHYNSVKRVD